MRNWLAICIVAVVVLLGVAVMASPAEACPYAERAAAASKQATDSGGCWTAGLLRWIVLGAGAWLALFLGSYRWGMKRL